MAELISCSRWLEVTQREGGKISLHPRSLVCSGTHSGTNQEGIIIDSQPRTSTSTSSSRYRRSSKGPTTALRIPRHSLPRRAFLPGTTSLSQLPLSYTPVATSLIMASPRPAGAIDIEVWTESTIETLSTLAISAATSTSRGSRGTTVKLDIPLDVDHLQQETADDAALADGAAMRARYVSKREPLRRDSMKRREALLKGKEGSRRRQKWENGACQPALYVL